jgi:hypothetical protein
MRFLQHSDYPCPRLLALWDAPRFPENEIVRVLCGFRRTSPPNECPVAGRSLKFGLSAVYGAEIRFVQLID